MMGGRLAAFALLLTLLLADATTSAEVARYDSALNARLFDRTWSLVDRRYWDRGMRGVDWVAARERFRPRAIAARSEQEVYSVLNAMLDTLRDSHVYALPPSRMRRLKARPVGGEAMGLGFVAVQEEGVWRIGSIAPGSPAAAAGIGIGWRLLSVDGRPVNAGYEPPDGADVTLALEDGRGVSRQIRLRPAGYSAEALWRAAMLRGGVLLLTLDSFDRGADRWLIERLSTEPRPAAVILDLRENGGGESRVLDRVAGAFFRSKQLVLRFAARREEREWTKGAGPKAFKGRLVVLVGPRTASAAEAFAAFIEETGRGITVGTRTAGRLTGAVHHRLSDGGELSIAQYDVRTPAGRRLEGEGFVPRQVVPGGLGDKGPRDMALQRAIELAQGK